MKTLAQKKFSIDSDQKKFLENYKQWGFTDQSSIVREALNRFIKELKIKERKRLMAQKAKELLPDYMEDKALIALTDLDGEDFL